MQEDSVELSVIFSFRNEQENIPLLIERVGKALTSCVRSFEIIFVNDDSSDGSLDLLRQHHERDHRIKIVNMSRRFGVTECVMAGLEHASGEAAVFLDADLQDPPEVIPQMVAEWRAGADVVHTVRQRRDGESRARVMLTSLAYRVISLFSDVDVPIDAGDFKLLSRRAIGHLLTMTETRPYIRGLIGWVGFRQSIVEYVRAPRHKGDAHFRFYGKSALFQLLNGLTSSSALPVYLVLMAGGILFVLAALAALAALFSSGPAIEKVSVFVIVSVTALMWSSILLALGIIGFYITRIDQNVRARPRYIVRDTIGLDGTNRN